MGALAQLATWSLLVFAIILLATQVAAREFGYLASAAPSRAARVAFILALTLILWKQTFLLISARIFA